MVYKEVNINQLFDGVIRGALDDVSNIIKSITYTEANNSDVTRYWWHAFDTNSKMLGVLINEPLSYYQFAMTIRLLLEISADLTFISENRGNIQRLNEEQQRIAEKQAHPGIYSYRQAARDARNKFKLYSDTDGKEITTTNRIKMTEDAQRLEDLYYWLCGTSHFNHMHIIWQGNNSSKTSPEQSAVDEFAYLLVFYPFFFNMTVKAIGKITDNKSLLNYDNTKMENALCNLGNAVVQD